MTFERCGCGAAIFTFSAKRAADWRTTHIHEVQPQSEYSEMPMVVESSARVEMAVPFGFTREMEGDVS